MFRNLEKAVEVFSRATEKFKSFSAADQAQLTAILIVIITLAVYLPAATFDSIIYDDPAYVYRNPNVLNGITTEGLQWAFTSLHGNVAYWHPLTWISHQLDAQLFQENARFHHITSVLIHSCNAALVFMFCLRLSFGLVFSAAVALLFSVHPLRVESVAWIAERKDVLCGFFYLLTLISYVHYAEKPNVRRYAATTALLLCALMSKPMAVTLPCVFLLLDFWPLKRLSVLPSGWADGPLPTTCSSWKVLLEKLPFFAITAVTCWLAMKAQASLGAITPDHELPFLDRVANAFIAYVSYIRMTLFPAGLSVHYAHPFLQPRWLVTVCLIAFATVAALVFRLRRSMPEVLFGWLWFLGILVPTIGFIQVGSQAMADRYTYLPSIGLNIGLATIAASIFRYIRWPIIPLVVAAFALLAALTAHQLHFWRDTRKLFEHAVRVDPADASAHLILGKEFVRTGHLDLAVPCLRQAAAHAQTAGLAYVTMADILCQRGLLFAAIPFYEQGLKSRQAEPYACVGIARIQHAFGESAEAVKNYRRALALMPRLLSPKFELARILASDPDLTVHDGNTALQLANELCTGTRHEVPQFLDLLAIAHASIGRFKEASMHAERAISKAIENGETQLAAEVRKRSQDFNAAKRFRDLPVEPPPLTLQTNLTWSQLFPDDNRSLNRVWLDKPTHNPIR